MDPGNTRLTQSLLENAIAARSAIRTCQVSRMPSMTGRRFRMNLSLDDCRWAVSPVGILLCHLGKFRMAVWPLSSAGSNRQRHSEWKFVQDEIGHRMRFIMDLNILPGKPPMYRHDVIFGPDRLVLTTCTKSEQRKHVTALDPDRGTSGVRWQRNAMACASSDFRQHPLRLCRRTACRVFVALWRLAAKTSPRRQSAIGD